MVDRHNIDQDTVKNFAGRPAYAHQEIDLRVVWKNIWDRRWLVIAVTTLFTVVSMAIAFYLPDQYRAKAVLAPAAEEQNLASRISSQLGGLASLAGITGKSTASDKTALSLEILKSRTFLSRFVETHDLTVPVVAGKGWSKTAQQWILDDDIYDEPAGQWLDDGKATTPPSTGKIHEAINRRLSIGENKKNGIVTITIESYSPKAAQQWVNWLVEDINNYMRARDIAEAKESIEFLKEQIDETASTELQKTFYQLIEDQTKTIMLANARDEYVFKIIDSAILPEEKSKPKRKIIVLGGMLGGGLCGLLIALISATLAGRKPTLSNN